MLKNFCHPHSTFRTARLVYYTEAPEPGSSDAAPKALDQELNQVVKKEIPELIVAGETGDNAAKRGKEKVAEKIGAAEKLAVIGTPTYDKDVEYNAHLSGREKFFDDLIDANADRYKKTENFIKTKTGLDATLATFVGEFKNVPTNAGDVALIRKSAVDIRGQLALIKANGTDFPELVKQSEEAANVVLAKLDGALEASKNRVRERIKALRGKIAVVENFKKAADPSTLRSEDFGAAVAELSAARAVDIQFLAFVDEHQDPSLNTECIAVNESIITTLEGVPEALLTNDTARRDRLLELHRNAENALKRYELLRYAPTRGPGYSEKVKAAEGELIGANRAYEDALGKFQKDTQANASKQGEILLLKRKATELDARMKRG